MVVNINHNRRRKDGGFGAAEAIRPVRVEAYGEIARIRRVAQNGVRGREEPVRGGNSIRADGSDFLAELFEAQLQSEQRAERVRIRPDVTGQEDASRPLYRLRRLFRPVRPC